jgi:hypothetical protein
VKSGQQKIKKSDSLGKTCKHFHEGELWLRKRSKMSNALNLIAKETLSLISRKENTLNLATFPYSKISQISV